MKRTEIDYNKIYYNAQNKAFKVIAEVEPRPDKNGQLRRRIRVKFIESGYETETYLSILNQKTISLTDYLSPTVYGVGMLGYAGARENWEMYQRWNNMLARCYDPDNENYKSYGAKNVYVCDRWLRFDYYLEDVVKLPGYEDMLNNPDIKYNLDKDILQQDQDEKVYSPNTCIWVPEIINNVQRTIDNKNKCSTKYVGVAQNSVGNYTMRFNGVHIATFTSEIAAASAYNYYSFVSGKPMVNDIPFMTPYEFSKYLVRPMQMVKYINDNYHGVMQLPYGNFRVSVYTNGRKEHIGVYTDKEIAAREYDRFAFNVGLPCKNNLPYISPQECTKYLVKPRVMCNIINPYALPILPMYNVPIQNQSNLKVMCTIVN